MLSEQASSALVDLDNGARMNCIHTVARELIAAGMAFDGWGKLEITEMGRRAARSLRSFTTDNPNIANMGDMNQPMFETPLNSHQIPDPDFVLAPIAPLAVRENVVISRTPDPDAADMVDRNKPTLAPQLEKLGLAWSRERATRAAGLANGEVGIWVDERWVSAFLDAYERIG